MLSLYLTKRRKHQQQRRLLLIITSLAALLLSASLFSTTSVGGGAASTTYFAGARGAQQYYTSIETKKQPTGLQNNSGISSSTGASTAPGMMSLANPKFVSTGGHHHHASDGLQHLTRFYDSNNGNNTFHGVIARSFEPWHGKLFAVIDGEKAAAAAALGKRKQQQQQQQRQPQQGSPLYLKPIKTGSTTAASVNMRMARNAARRTNTTINGAFTRRMYDHSLAREMPFAARDNKSNFLWTSFRDPTDRFVSSYFYFVVSTHGVVPSTTGLKKFVKKHEEKKRCAHYLTRASTQPYHEGVSDPVEYANKIMSDYNFIAITERFDEALVAMSMLNSIPLADILYVSSKQSGRRGYKLCNGKCRILAPSNITDSMREYFQTPWFQECTKWDHILHQAVNRSLDLTIDERLGRVAFEQQLAKYQHAQQVVKERCGDRVVQPCSAGNGTMKTEAETDCIYRDMGCGFGCLDEVATELNLWQAISGA